MLDCQTAELQGILFVTRFVAYMEFQWLWLAVIN